MSTPELTTYQYGGLRIMGVETQVIEDLFNICELGISCHKRRRGGASAMRAALFTGFLKAESFDLA